MSDTVSVMGGTVSVLLFIGVIAYALFGGADFGAGFWDLTAGGAARGSRPRRLIDASIGPVWEANHIWLIYCLVMLWSAFPAAFTAITTTLYIPLGLAALGIVLRGAGFAFRKASMRTPEQRIYGATFALSSVLTPYCFGSVAGAIASGRVPTTGKGDPLGSWNNPTSVLGGILAVSVCAYLAAMFLTASARQNQSPPLERWFRRRALLAGVVTGLVGLAGIFVLQADSPRLFHQLSHRGLPLLIVSALSGLLSLFLLRREKPLALRMLAALAVATVVCGWGVAQYPYLLGTHLTIAEAAAPAPTLWVLTGVACAAGLLVAPSLAVLYVLQNRGRLESRT
ncbi:MULTISPECIES: cytochrome d ubiquinol oxidase subunit II [unclassified Streptomyces]|uniref:cytochrome d ubiquinol oxidase subunit II n=1 Tax=unclassified Streptomyces TaxID=2593676 RepID=UPI00081E2ECF|nr:MULTISPECIES: cytochrome d ubiquinol oxidase subunit II [unclassified Streptomyces]SCF90799.1 cytochrome bd-I ubiquinol oxidase subunit 2 apoprotein [Streptomyces sp. MnatMP-M17]